MDDAPKTGALATEGVASQSGEAGNPEEGSATPVKETLATASKGEEQTPEPKETPKGDELPGWSTTVPTELRPYTKGFESYAEFLKAGIEARERTQNALVKPGEDATPEQVDEFWKALGRPDSAEGYELSVDEQDGFDAEALEGFKQKAHEINLLPQQAQALIDWFKEESAAAAYNPEQARADAEEELRQAWPGEQFTKEMAHVRRALLAYNDDGFMEYLDTSGAGNHPELLKHLAWVGHQLTAGGFAPGKGAQPDSGQRMLRDMYPSMND